MSDMNNMNAGTGQPAGQPTGQPLGQPVGQPTGQPHPSMPLPSNGQAAQPQGGQVQPGTSSANQPMTNAQGSFQQPQSTQAASQAASQAAQPTASQATQPQSQPVKQVVAMPSHPVAAMPQHAQPQKKSGVKAFFAAFVGAVLGCALVFCVMSFFPTDTGSGTHASQVTANLGASETTVIDASVNDATLATAVAAKCLPSVAAIDVYARTSTNYSNIYGFGFGIEDSGELSASGLGSGVVLSSDGYVITNYHVVSGGERFEVTVDGETYEATLVGSDPSSDVAVLKCQDASDLSAMEIGDSDDLVIGEWVMSIGSPFGLEQSVATGIVSATSRSQIMDSSDTSSGVTIYPNMIQTDAAINPGNSGGALVDANGQLVGINTLITSYSGNYSGVGFAIPVNYAINIAQQIIDGQAPTHAQLGVSLVSINAQMAERYGLAVSAGAYVSSVAPNSGAAAAGIEEGDIITAFDGKKVESASDLMLDVRTKNPGDTATLTVVTEDGTSHEVQVVLGADTTQRS